MHMHIEKQIFYVIVLKTFSLPSWSWCKYFTYTYVAGYVCAYVTGFVKTDPNRTTTEIHLIA